MKIFGSTDILLPKSADMHRWAVIACDQFTSDQAYWNRVRATAGDAPSTIHLILPEADLGTEREESHISHINQTMEEYGKNHIFHVYPNSYVYVERTLENGTIRKGLVGAVDLEAYDYTVGSESQIRATEKTVVERIPPRIHIRRDACLEMPHVLLLIDDPAASIIEPLKNKKDCLQTAYDFDLMQGGGNIKGYFLDEATKEQISNALDALVAQSEDKMLFAVGDGNHSLATAKECSAINQSEKAKRAMVEIVNIHDDAIQFEPIYRVLFNVDPDDLLNAFVETLGGEYEGEDSQEFAFVTKDITRIVSVKPTANLPVGTLQPFLDDYLLTHLEAKIDYIHGEAVVHDLCMTNDTTCGFIFKGMEKSDLFPAVKEDGSLPRKTFSMGHACDKRFYLEARKIK
jgi:uncharacterized protein (DUF1015 family)